ncbi:hypothetical protein K449DRAFT_382146 [Hypoxylon sp. EC38]|nr:hypothetical protein K449DRAFT_382146 [Hypoxylon sp. EC38]
MTSPAIIALVALVLGLPTTALALYKCWRMLQRHRAGRMLIRFFFNRYQYGNVANQYISIISRATSTFTSILEPTI